MKIFNTMTRQKEELTPRVADVHIIVHRGAAHINAVFAGHLRRQFLFLAGHRIKNFHMNSSFR